MRKVIHKTDYDHYEWEGLTITTILVNPRYSRPLDRKKLNECWSTCVKITQKKIKGFSKLVKKVGAKTYKKCRMFNMLVSREKTIERKVWKNRLPNHAVSRHIKLEPNLQFGMKKLERLCPRKHFQSMLRFPSSDWIWTLQCSRVPLLTK